MAETEKLKFKVGSSGTSPDKQPQYRIGINGKGKVFGVLSAGVNETEYVEFESSLTEGPQSLEIELLNKGYGDTMTDENGEIISDFLLNIDSIEIDEIDLGTLKWTLSEYYPIYPRDYVNHVLAETGNKPDEVVKSCVNMGWNGKWTLPLESPFYIWLLENL